MKELMVRAIYCESLGYEASFVYIHAIKLAQQGTALEKRVGKIDFRELKKQNKVPASSRSKYITIDKTYFLILTFKYNEILSFYAYVKPIGAVLCFRLPCCVIVSE